MYSFDAVTRNAWQEEDTLKTLVPALLAVRLLNNCLQEVGDCPRAEKEALKPDAGQERLSPGRT